MLVQILVVMVVLAAVLQILLPQVASARIEKVTSADKLAEDRPTKAKAKAGLRFYRPAPYILVSVVAVKDDETTLKTEVVWLPDLSETYAIRPSGWIGSADLTVSLSNGWNLTEFTLNRDAKAPEMVEQLTGAVTGIVGTSQLEQVSRVIWPTGLDLSPGLYRLEYDEEEGHIERLVPIG